MTREAELVRTLTSGCYALIGAGQLGEMSLAMWPQDVPRPEFILDSVKTGQLDGIEIKPLAGHTHIPGVTYLLSAFKMPPADIRAIFAGVDQADIITIYDFFEQHTPTLFSNGWRDLSPSPEVQEQSRRLPDYFADDLSRQICAAVNAWRFQRELLDEYPVSGEEKKYDLNLLGRGGWHYDVIYDGGAYDLGLLKYLSKANISWDRVVAFEPDPACATRCFENLPTCSKQGRASITLDRRALSDKTGTALFLASGLLSSRLIEMEGVDPAVLTEVETVVLDDLHSSASHGGCERILLKLHIEGAELPALRGAEALLRNHAVDILVNLSHDKRSWLEIPEFLASLDRHDLFLHSHALFGEGLTLFARSRD